MAEVRDRAAWNRTFAVLAQLFNANRDPEKTRPIDPMAFFPWGKQAEEQAPAPTGFTTTHRLSCSGWQMSSTSSKPNVPT